jgi:hypothetical protein
MYPAEFAAGALVVVPGGDFTGTSLAGRTDADQSNVGMNLIVFDYRNARPGKAKA